jgi:hypothetical protein
VSHATAHAGHVMDHSKQTVCHVLAASSMTQSRRSASQGARVGSTSTQHPRYVSSATPTASSAVDPLTRTATTATQGSSSTPPPHSARNSVPLLPTGLPIRHASHATTTVSHVMVLVCLGVSSVCSTSQQSSPPYPDSVCATPHNQSMHTPSTAGTTVSHVM